MRTTLPLAATFALAASLVGGGCGGSGDDGGDAKTTPAAPTTTQTPTPAHGLTVKMSDFAFAPQDAVSKAGKVTITAPNEGNVVHELVILRTDASPAHLPMKNGAVDESTSVGEIADVEPGATKRTTLRLAPGKYVMVCALPGHYKAGMYGSLTVK
jgi:uncharacterized cupredoxin-like copper-binding protein